MKVKVGQLCPTLCDPMDCSSPASFLCPWVFSRQEYWSGLLCPPSGDLPNPGIKPWSPTLQQILYHLSHQRSPRILEWVAYPFSRASSCPRNWTRASCIAGRFFTSWATREVHAHKKSKRNKISPSYSSTDTGTVHSQQRITPHTLHPSCFF